MTVAAGGGYRLFHGTGVTGPFTWTWRFFANSDISVTKIVDGESVVLVEGDDYTITGAGTYQGGSVTLNVALAVGEDLVVERNTSSLQPVSIRNQGNNFRPEVHEEVFDRLVMMVQDRDRTIASLLERIAAMELGANYVNDSEGNGYQLNIVDNGDGTWTPQYIRVR